MHGENQVYKNRGAGDIWYTRNAPITVSCEQGLTKQLAGFGCVRTPHLTLIRVFRLIRTVLVHLRPSNGAKRRSKVDCYTLD